MTKEGKRYKNRKGDAGSSPFVYSKRKGRFLIAPVVVTQQEKMAVVNFTKTNALTGGSTFFVTTPCCDAKSTDLKVKVVAMVDFV